MQWLVVVIIATIVYREVRHAQLIAQQREAYSRFMEEQEQDLRREINHLKGQLQDLKQRQATTEQHLFNLRGGAPGRAE